MYLALHQLVHNAICLLGIFIKKNLREEGRNPRRGRFEFKNGKTFFKWLTASPDHKNMSCIHYLSPSLMTENKISPHFWGDLLVRKTLPTSRIGHVSQTFHSFLSASCFFICIMHSCHGAIEISGISGSLYHSMMHHHSAYWWRRHLTSATN